MSSTYLKNWPFVSFHPSTLHSQIDLIWLNIRNFIFVKNQLKAAFFLKTFDA
jgi:hypothetical protein